MCLSPTYDTEGLVVLFCFGGGGGVLTLDTSAPGMSTAEQIVGFAQGTVSGELQYYLGAGFHVGAQLRGGAEVGQIAAERADGSRVFSTSPTGSVEVLLGVGIALGGTSERTPAQRPLGTRSASPRGCAPLFDAHYPSIWRLLRRLGVRQAQLDDATQEVFWVAARRLGDIKRGSESAFLYGVALRVASQEVRRQAAAMPLAALAEVPLLVDERPPADEQLADREARALLDEALAALPLDLRMVLVLHELEGLEVRADRRDRGDPRRHRQLAAAAGARGVLGHRETDARPAAARGGHG